MSEAIKELLKKVDALKEQLSTLRPLPEDFQKLVVEAEIAALQKYLSIMA